MARHTPSVRNRGALAHRWATGGAFVGWVSRAGYRRMPSRVTAFAVGLTRSIGCGEWVAAFFSLRFRAEVDYAYGNMESLGSSNRLSVKFDF